MAIEQIRTFTRPNTSVNFRETSYNEEITAYIQNIDNEFTANGSITLSDTTSDDGLVLTTSQTFSSIEIFCAYNEAYDRTMLANGHPLGNAIFTINHQYYHNNGITFAQTRNFNV